MKQLMWSVLVLLSRAAFAENQLSFEEVLNRMVDQDYQVKKSLNDQEIAKVRSAQSKMNFLPSISAKGALNRHDLGDASVMEQRTGVGGDLNLFRFGGDRALMKAAEADLAYAEQNVSYERKVSEHMHANELLELIAQQARLKVGLDLLKLRKDNLELTNRLVARGAKPKQDVDKMSIDYANEEVKSQNSRIQFDKYLANIRGQLADQVDVKTDWPWQNFIAQKKQPTLPDGNIESLPGYKLLASRLENAGAKVVQARSGFLPSLDLNGQHDWVKDRKEGATYKEWSSALVLTVPLSQKGSAASEYRQKLIEKQTIEDEIESYRRSKGVQLKNLRDRLNQNLVILEQSKNSTLKAENLYKQSLIFFQKGSLSVNDLNADQTRLFDAQFSLVQSLSDVHQTLNDLCFAYGQALSDCLR